MDVSPFSGSARTNTIGRGPEAGGVIILLTVAVTGSIPAVHVSLVLLHFCALGRKSQRAQKGELCAVALAKVVRLGVGHACIIFWRFV